MKIHIDLLYFGCIWTLTKKTLPKTALFPSSTDTVNRGWQASGSCACASGADRGNSRGVVKQSTIREKEGRKEDERRPSAPVPLRRCPVETIMLFPAPSLPLECPLPGRWMALVTVQRSPTPSTSSSPCVSVKAAFHSPPDSASVFIPTKAKSHTCVRGLKASFPLPFFLSAADCH